MFPLKFAEVIISFSLLIIVSFLNKSGDIKNSGFILSLKPSNAFRDKHSLLSCSIKYLKVKLNLFLYNAKIVFLFIIVSSVIL